MVTGCLATGCAFQRELKAEQRVLSHPLLRFSLKEIWFYAVTGSFTLKGICFGCATALFGMCSVNTPCL